MRKAMNPALYIFSRTSGLLATSRRALMAYFFLIPSAMRRSQTLSTQSMSAVKISSANPTIGALMVFISETTDSGLLTDHFLFSPRGLNLKSQNLQLKGQPLDPSMRSISTSVVNSSTETIYLYRRRFLFG